MSLRSFLRGARGRRANPDRFGTPDGVQIKNEHVDHHHGQDDFVVRALDGQGRRVGVLRYVVFRGRTSIQRIDSVAPGVGSAMIRWLAEEAGGYDRVRWGLLTEDGARLKAKLDAEFQYKPPGVFDVEGFVAAHGARILSRHSNGTTVEVYLELHPAAVSGLLAAVEALPYEEPLDTAEAPDVQAREEVAWVNVHLPARTPATLGGRVASPWGPALRANPLPAGAPQGEAYVLGQLRKRLGDGITPDDLHDMLHELAHWACLGRPVDSLPASRRDLEKVIREDLDRRSRGGTTLALLVTEELRAVAANGLLNEALGVRERSVEALFGRTAQGLGAGLDTDRAWRRVQGYARQPGLRRRCEALAAWLRDA